MYLGIFCWILQGPFSVENLGNPKDSVCELLPETKHLGEGGFGEALDHQKSEDLISFIYPTWIFPLCVILHLSKAVLQCLSLQD